jgi:hypothetical protein
MAMTRKKFSRRLAGAAVLLVVVALGFIPVTARRAEAASTSTPWQKLSPSQMSAVWWQWALSNQVSTSPLFDETGADAFNNQPYSDLLFLCGTFIAQQEVNGDVLGEVTRKITVKQGTAIFFPLLNNEWDNVGAAPGQHLQGKPGGALSIPQMRALAAGTLDEATGLVAQLTPANSDFSEPTGDTVNLDIARLVSPVFSYKLPRADNLYQNAGVNVSGAIAPAVADGYFAFIPGNALPPGNYVLEFGGSEPFVGSDNQTHTFSEAITYHITVTE